MSPRDSLGVPQHDRPHIVFVPVDGRTVFLVCLLLIVLCVGWFLILWQTGRHVDRR